MAQDSVESLLQKTRREAEERDAQRRSVKVGFPYINLALKAVETDAIQLIEESKAKEAQAACVEYKGNNVVFTAYDPKSEKAQAVIKELEAKGLKLKIFVVSLTSLQRAWDFYKYTVKKTAPLTGQMDIDKERISALMKELTHLEKVREGILNFDFKKFSTAQVLEIVLAGALANRASDIHFEPKKR